MKKTAIILGIFLCSNAYTQVGNILLKKTGGLINKKETKADTTSNSNSATPEKTETNANPWAAKMGGKSDAQAEYNFSSNALVEIQNYKKSGETKDDAVQVRYHFSDNEYYGTEMVMTDKKGKTTTSFGVSEFSKNQIVSLITDEKGEKTGTVMKIDLQKAIDKHSDTSDVTIKKTGKTKTILTYFCEEYIITDKDGNVTETWMTTALPFDMKKMTAGNRGGKSYGNYSNGFMMEMTHTDKGGEKTTWKVLEVNLTAAKKIVTADYTFPF